MSAPSKPLRTSHLALTLWCLAWLPAPQAAIAATAAFKCVASSGAVSYQDAPCPRGQHQQRLTLDDAPAPAVPAASAPAGSTPAPAAPPAPAEPPQPTAPPPQLYGCVRATDGKPFLSARPTSPYLAPLGMLGAFSAPLAQVYGPGGGGGISAPEAQRGKVSADLVANHYTWVQDSCQLLSPQQACQALRDEAEQLDRQIGHAFKSDQPPLLQRQQALQQQLAGCR